MKMQEFTIKDLENFTGIKAHTIRIWEQRYGLLSPDRSDTNIRKYSDRDLKFLLNVSLLNSLGFKISQIASMSEDQMRETITKHAANQQPEQHFLHVLKISMLNYDEEMFNGVVENYISENGYGKNVQRIGLFLFYSRLAFYGRQCDLPSSRALYFGTCSSKDFFEIDKIEQPDRKNHAPIVLYLPELEIHELSGYDPLSPQAKRLQKYIPRSECPLRI
ncbi:MAG: MerR family transcriptional regulator [Flavobacteriales bacterium]